MKFHEDTLNGFQVTQINKHIRFDIQYADTAEENQGCFSFGDRRGLYSKSSKMLPMSGFWPPRRLLYEKADLWKLRWRKALQ